MTLKILALSEFMTKAYPQPDPVIEGIISRSELIILSAKAKSYKSMLTTKMALDVAHGRSFLGQFETTKSNVLIVQTEVSHASFQDRVRMLNQDDDLESSNVFILESNRLRIDSDGDLELLEEEIKKRDIGLLILDPLYTLHRGDENSAEQMGKILGGLNKVVNETNVACLLVHHQGKRHESSEAGQVSQRHRGSSAISDVPDGSISIAKRSENEIRLSFEFRNRESPQPIDAKFDDGVFSLIGNVKPKSMLQDEILSLFVSSPAGLMRQDIVAAFSSVSDRTVDTKLKWLTDRGQLTKTGGGKTTLFSLPKSTLKH